jgi:uncharacterized delta-60 repeat protein
LRKARARGRTREIVYVLSRTSLFAVALCAAAGAASSSHAADGVPDPGFGTGGVSLIHTDGTDVLAIVPGDVLALPDGQLLFAGGRYTAIPGHPPELPQIRGMLARLGADGQPAAGFGNTPEPGVIELPDLVPGTRIQDIEGLARTTDGAFIAVGTGLDGAPTQAYVIRLTAAGALDPTFGNQGVVLLPDVSLHAVALDSRGRIVACGEKMIDAPFSMQSTVVRLSADGALDATFGNAGVVPIAWSQVGADGYLEDVAITADDGIVVGGQFAAYGPGVNKDFAIARLDANGAFDTRFAGQGWRVFHDANDASQRNGIDRIALLPDGRIAFAGHVAAGEGMQTGVVLGRLNADGEADASFGDLATPGFLRIGAPSDALGLSATGLVAQSDGKLVASVSWFAAAGKQNFFALRSTSAGRLDTDFATQGIFQADLAPSGLFSDVRTLLLQTDGRIVLGGRTRRASDSSEVDFAAMRLLNDSAVSDRIFVDGFEQQVRRGD